MQNKKEHTLYTPKGNIKKSNKIKKDVDKVSKMWYYLIVARRKNENWNQNLKLESKWDGDIWITTLLGKRILKSISEWEFKNWNRYLDNHPCGGVVNG